VPVLILVAGFFVIRRRDVRPGAMLAAAVAGAVGLYDIVKPAVGRMRPPSTIWIGHYTGGAFPSGHATQAVAFYDMLALVLSRGRAVRTRAWLWGAAALVALVVGASRVYLGAHWVSDVLGGYALGATWLAIVVAVTLVARRPTKGTVESIESESGAGRRRHRGKAA
jgi:membrane-associated phospholipid phosphatase